MLLDGNGLCQIPRLIYVASAPDGDVIREQLQGHDFEYRRKYFRRRANLDDVLGRLTSDAVAFGNNRNHDSVACAHFLEI